MVQFLTRGNIYLRDLSNRKVFARLLIRLCTTLFALTCSLPVAAQEYYKIRLKQPDRAGTRYFLSASSSESLKRKVTFGNQVLHNSEVGFTLELTGEVTVLAVNAENWATRKSLKILSSTFTREGKATALLPQGSTVVASLENGQPVYRMRNKPVDLEVSRALRTVLSLHTTNTDDDELFGTAAKKRVGETWDLNRQAIMKFLQEMNVAGRSEDIKGTGTLEKVMDNYMFVRASMEIGNAFLFPLPEGFKADRGEIRSEMSGRFPINESDRSFDYGFSMRITTSGKAPPDPVESQTKVEIVLDSSGRFQIRAMKPGGRVSRFKSRK